MIRTVSLDYRQPQSTDVKQDKEYPLPKKCNKRISRCHNISTYKNIFETKCVAENIRVQQRKKIITTRLVANCENRRNTLRPEQFVTDVDIRKAGTNAWTFILH